MQRFIYIVLIVSLAFSGHGQSVSPLANHPLFLHFINIAAIQPDRFGDISALLARRSYPNPGVDELNHNFFGLRYQRLLNQNFEALFTGQFSYSIFEPAKYTSSSLGGAFVFKGETPNMLFFRRFTEGNLSTKNPEFRIVVGIQAGYGRWEIGPPEQLLPWDLGDPLLEGELFPAGSFHFGAAVFSRYEIPFTKLKGFKTLGAYLGFSLPYMNFCKTNDCYVFPSISSTTFYINRSDGWNSFIRSHQLGFYLKKNENAAFRFDFFRRKDFSTPANYGGRLSVPFEIPIDKSAYLIVSAGCDRAKSLQVGLDASFMLKSFRVHLTFNYLNGRQLQALGAATDVFLQFDRELR